MNRRHLACLVLSVLLLVPACSTTPEISPTPIQLLAAAEQQLADKEFDSAIATLAPLAERQCPKRLRDRRDLIIAKAELARENPWEAFLALEEFSTLYPHSDLRDQAIEVIWDAGETLIGSDGGFLFFWSDKRAGRTVLEHLISHFPETQRLADALRILGDQAFEDTDYELAQLRYRDIIQSRPDSHWRFYAQFRYSMSIVASLRGSDYDLNRMGQAVGELRAFLGTNPESPQMLAQCNAALLKVMTWQVQRHLDVAEYYKELNSAEGIRHHLRLATREDFVNIPGYERALKLRNEFEANNTTNATDIAALQARGKR
jgi:outer membrane protein assembly factor BamD (BamD/ComL family)